MSKTVRFIIVYIIVLVIAVIGLVNYFSNASRTGCVMNQIYITRGNQKDIEHTLENNLKQQYANILNYEYVNIFGYDILDMQVYRQGSFPISYKPNSSKMEKLEHMITVLDTIPYTESQNNPAHWKQGLNCQGYSLLFRQLCRSKNIDNSIVHDSNHMFNIVTLNGKTYKIDLVNHIMERI